MKHRHRNPLVVRNSGKAQLLVIVEPWADEYELPPGASCEVVATNPEVLPTMGVEPLEGRLIVWVNEGGSLYEFRRDGVRID